jgi:hypothetical protein
MQLAIGCCWCIATDALQAAHFLLVITLMWLRRSVFARAKQQGVIVLINR